MRPLLGYLATLSASLVVTTACVSSLTRPTQAHHGEGHVSPSTLSVLQQRADQYARTLEALESGDVDYLNQQKGQ